MTTIKQATSPVQRRLTDMKAGDEVLSLIHISEPTRPY